MPSPIGVPSRYVWSRMGSKCPCPGWRSRRQSRPPAGRPVSRDLLQHPPADRSPRAHRAVPRDRPAGRRPGARVGRRPGVEAGLRAARRLGHDRGLRPRPTRLLEAPQGRRRHPHRGRRRGRRLDRSRDPRRDPRRPPIPSPGRNPGLNRLPTRQVDRHLGRNRGLPRGLHQPVGRRFSLDPRRDRRRDRSRDPRRDQHRLAVHDRPPGPNRAAPVRASRISNVASQSPTSPPEIGRMRPTRPRILRRPSVKRFATTRPTSSRRSSRTMTSVRSNSPKS